MKPLMTTSKLIILRLFNITLGRVPLFSRGLKSLLIMILITKRKKSKYVASSRFFGWRDLNEGSQKTTEV